MPLRYWEEERSSRRRGGRFPSCECRQRRGAGKVHSARRGGIVAYGIAETSAERERAQGVERRDRVVDQVVRGQRPLSGGLRGPLDRQVLDVREPGVHRQPRGGTVRQQCEHPLGQRRAGLVVHLDDESVAAGRAAHPGDVGVAPPVDERNVRRQHRAQLLVRRQGWIGPGLPQQPPAGGPHHLDVEVPLRREVVEQQPPRDPRLGRHRVDRQLVDRMHGQHPEPNPDQLLAPVVRGQPPSCVLRHHTIEHCSTGALPSNDERRENAMGFEPSARGQRLIEQVGEFIRTEIEPVEPQVHEAVRVARETGGDPWKPHPVMAELQAKARARGLWNLFLPEAAELGYGEGLNNLDYAYVAELTGRSFLAPYVFNCNAPDTGNMEVLVKYGSAEQRKEWLEPLLDGRIRSAFCMTEPGTASSDATNMEATAVVEGDEVVVNGRKWWSTGVGHPDCKILIFMGLTDPG